MDKVNIPILLGTNRKLRYQNLAKRLLTTLEAIDVANRFSFTAPARVRFA